MGPALRVLLVDDEPSIRKMIGQRLRAEGLEVELASDGYEAVTKAQTGAYDAIVLDLMLPQLNGYEVCGVLKKDSRSQRTPIIIYTAKGSDTARELCMENGADAYLEKAEGAAAVLAKIRELVPRPSF